MADAFRINHCEEECAALDKRVDTVEEIGAITSDRVRTIELWRNGNGAKGAEVRLQDAEKSVRALEDADPDKRLNALEADVKVIQQVTDASIRFSVGTALDERDKTAVARVKAWGPIVAATVAALAVVAQSIVGKF